MPKLRETKLNQAVLEKLEKYERLVSYARKLPEDYKFDAVRRNAELVKFNYPDEEAELRGPKGDWQHGFHSGMLAAMRFVIEFQELGPDTAEQWFPNLDT